MRAARWGIGAVVWLLSTGGMHFALGATEDVEKGQAIYQKHCLACHGAQGRGETPMGKALNPPATNFGTLQYKKKADEELLAILRNGVDRTAMRAWDKTLSEQEMRDVLAYIRKLSQ
jgi:mono/diheme cytochrome c family protein